MAEIVSGSNIERTMENDKEEEPAEKINIFLSYCQKDSDEANRICDYFGNSKNIELHRDIIDIRAWGNIKEFIGWYGDTGITEHGRNDARLRLGVFFYAQARTEEICR